MTDLSLWFDESPALQLLNTAQAHSLAHYTQVVKADQQLLTAWPYDMSIMIGASAIVSTHFYSPSYMDPEGTATPPVYVLGPHPEMSATKEMTQIMIKLISDLIARTTGHTTIAD